MRTPALFIAVVCASSGCAGAYQATPPPVQASSPQTPATAMLGSQGGESENALRAALEKTRRSAAAAEEAGAAAQAANEAVVREANAARAAHAGPSDEDCARTRAVRSADAQYYARESIALTHRAAAAQCRLTLSSTGAVNFSNGRAYAEKQEGVACAKPLPKGLTKEQAAYVVSVLQPGASVRATNGSEYEAENARCAKADGAVGLDTQVLFSDAKGLVLLTRWSETPSVSAQSANAAAAPEPSAP